VPRGNSLVHVGLNKLAYGNSLRLTSHGKPRTLKCLDSPLEPLRYFGQRVLASYPVVNSFAWSVRIRRNPLSSLW